LCARARFAYVRLLEFGNGDYAWSRFLDDVNDRGFGNRGAWPLHGPRLSPRNVFRPGPLSLSYNFLWPQLARGPLSRLTSYGFGGLAHSIAPCRLSFSSGNSLFALSHDRRLC